ncbi:replication protein A 70 kDa dna-binding subunit, partial [Trifolium medium]|nr:replication protein A 70 kDa dna-binding subunit [Trifolium medium]
MNCSVLIFNSKCAESVAFRSSLAETLDTPSPMTLTQLSVESRVEPIEEFLYNTPRITLQSLRDATSGSFHVVAATIKRILNPDSFYYTACICSKAVIPDSRMWYCEKCNKHVVRVFPRFCVKVRVMDTTDSATFVIFDKDANLLLDMSCAEMIREMEITGTVGLMPPQLQELVDKTWLFKIEAKANQNPNFEQSFRVRKICTDAAIIDQFLAKWNKEEAAVGKSLNECGSLSTLLEKGKDALIGGSSNLLSEDYDSLSASDVKGKGAIIEGTPIGVSQDLMEKFSTDVVHLDDDSMPTIGSSKTVSTESQETP